MKKMASRVLSLKAVKFTQISRPISRCLNIPTAKSTYLLYKPTFSQPIRFVSRLNVGQNRGKLKGFIATGVLLGAAVSVGFCAGEISTVIAADSTVSFKPSRSVIFNQDNNGLKLVLFQYQTCPFCCKVRAFLDFNSISYDIIEVDPVMRQQIKFSKWRKVPILMVKERENQEFQQLNDSSLIISLIQSYLLSSSNSVEELANYYPIIESKNDKGKNVLEIQNRYKLMLGEKVTTDDKTLTEEEKWREWADDVLVHTLSPNVYRTFGEALDSFKWFSRVGDWESNFPWWERTMVIYVGAAAMFLISKRLKKRHKLNDDVRMSLYESCDQWVQALGPQRPFMGGPKPNLADLAVYGVLNSIEGCGAFRDLLVSTKIGPWFYKMKALTDGKVIVKA